MFLANPDRYAPALNGNSVVEYVRSGNLVPGHTRFGLFYKGRVYLFQNEREQQQFQADRQAYADADLAYRGESVVSLLDANRRSPGSPKFATRYGGFRFFFTSAEQRDKFLGNPARYVQSNRAGR